METEQANRFRGFRFVSPFDRASGVILRPHQPLANWAGPAMLPPTPSSVWPSNPVVSEPRDAGMTAVAERPAQAMTERKGRQSRAADHMTFAALLTAVGCARLFVKHALHNWRIEREHIETAELLASELVANAVKSTGIADPGLAYSALKHLALIQVRLLLFEHSVVLEVWDTDPTPPFMQEQAPDTDGSRGLLLVATMNRRWNYYHPKSGGKAVWCEIDTLPWPTDSDTTELPRVLPRRKRYAGPYRPTEVTRDPELLRRVLEGLYALDDVEEQKGY